jgi:hypothetical protein
VSEERTEQAAQSSQAPALRVVRGEPDAAELAALVTVLAAASSGEGRPPAPVRSAWADPSRSVRTPLTRGGWRTSLAPR